MSEHHITLNWEKGDAPFTYDAYPRNHTLGFKNGQEVMIASSSPVYKGDASKADPEDMLVAALSSCHMLSFLAIASKKKLFQWQRWEIVDRPRDPAAQGDDRRRS
jgi:organic hydroperoxide reductase OsmC/OhrA